MSIEASQATRNLPRAGFFETEETAYFASVEAGLARLHRPLLLVQSPNGIRACDSGTVDWKPTTSASQYLLAQLPPSPLQNLGSQDFCHAFGIDYAYVAGSMAKGISSVSLVQEFSRLGMLAFFGAGGLNIPDIDAAILQLQQSLGKNAWGVNLLHSPTEPRLEQGTVDLLLQRQVRLAEAAAYLDLTADIVRYRTAGIHRDAQGKVVVPNRIIAKVSREEIAEKFCSPPPSNHLRTLVDQGALTEEQAVMAATIPMADAITAEADSGGHSDNRPMPALFPTIRAVRDRVVQQQDYDRPLYVGVGGGIGTPAAAASALALGADYLVTGSINQACVESGTSDAVRQMLAETRQGDITMAPAADMFEMGGKVQVIKRGTMFSMRAAKLYDLYRSYHDWQAVPAQERLKLEKTVFQATFDEIWQNTRTYFQQHDPSQATRGEQDGRHRMALVFRWYLGMTPHWANRGEDGRKIDYQIWCGPAMGAFNEWVRGSFLAEPRERRVTTVAMNILWGAAVQLRRLQLRNQGFPIETLQPAPGPVPLEQLKEYLR